MNRDVLKIIEDSQKLSRDGLEMRNRLKRCVEEITMICDQISEDIESSLELINEAKNQLKEGKSQKD